MRLVLPTVRVSPARRQRVELLFGADRLRRGVAAVRRRHGVTARRRCVDHRAGTVQADGDSVRAAPTCRFTAAGCHGGSAIA